MMPKQTRILKNRVAELMVIKARKENRPRRLSNRQVAEETGLSIITVNQYVKNAVARYEKRTLEIFADYFGCGIQDLLVFEETKENESPESKIPLPAA